MFQEFSSENLENRVEELQELIQTSEEKIEKLIEKDDHTFQNFMKTYQMIHEKIDWFFTPISILQYTKNSELTQKIYSESLPILTEFNTNQKQDLRLFKIFKEILDMEKGSLTTAQKKVLEDGILEFRLDGAELEEKKKKRIKEINIRLSELSNNFSQNLLDATTKYETVLKDDSTILDMPSSDKELAKFEEDGKTKYKFTLQPPSFSALITYCSDQAKREEIYRAYTTRAPENGKIIEEILKLKKEKVGLLGFENYAEYSVATKMADSSDEVLKFLEELKEKSLAQGKKELEELESFAGKKLNSFDTGYYGKKLEKEKYSIDDEKYKPYFEQNSVVNGLLDFLSKLLNVEFKKTTANVWDEKVLVFDIKENGKPMARIHMDLEARDEKRDGAWMDSWQHHGVDEEGEKILASAYISCNFTPAKNGNPSLLKHDEVVTLFHEMGHGIHHMFSKVEEPFVSGISGVEWDAVEFPSQWLENFAYEKEVLKMFAKHHETGEVIPGEMIDNLIRAKNFMSASAMLRQLEFGIFDMKIHKTATTEEEVQKILDEVRAETALIQPPSYNKFQNGFSHIFGGGYAAGYYSYKWAEVLSADGYYKFVDDGIFNQKTGKRFRETVLALGGSKKAKEIFVEFAGREPHVDALLKLSGIE